MNLRPTNLPLTVKEFDEVKCGVCAGCGCSCGYILYLKEGRVVDLYGNPHDPNGIGSLCGKGIALIQEATSSPLRLRGILKREGEDFKGIDRQEAIRWIRENIKGKIGIFLDRLSDLRDYAVASQITENLYSDSLYLPFRPSTVRPQEWRDQKVILSLECETVFSEVMSTRWLVDAFERSAYILAVSSRYGTTSAKATERLLLKPPLVVRFLEELADFMEGKERDYLFRDKVERLAKAFSSIDRSVVLVGDTLLRTRWRGSVLNCLKRMRKKAKVNYTIVGNVSPYRSREIPDFVKDLETIDALILFGNPAIYLSEEKLRSLSDKKVLSFSVFPNLTVNHSDLSIPSTLFPEREFFIFRNGFGFFSFSPQTLQRTEGVFNPFEILEEAFGVRGDTDSLLRSVGLDEEVLRSEEGGVEVSLPLIEELEDFESEPIEDEGLYILCDYYLVDEMGHWNVWTHDTERKQFAYVNDRTCERYGFGEEVEIRGIKLRVKRNNNIADDVIYVPSSFEETQPFNPGVRIGRLLENGGFRIEPLR